MRENPTKVVPIPLNEYAKGPTVYLKNGPDFPCMSQEVPGKASRKEVSKDISREMYSRGKVHIFNSFNTLSQQNRMYYFNSQTAQSQRGLFGSDMHLFSGIYFKVCMLRTAPRLITKSVPRQ